MNTRPEMKKYRGLISAFIVYAIATIALICGVILLIAGLADSQPSFSQLYIYVGAACIITGIFLFIIANIAEDIHFQNYLTSYYGEEDIQYHEQSLQILQDIRAMLQQKYYPQQTPYSFPPQVHEKYEQQQVYQPMSQQQVMQFQAPESHSEAETMMRQTDTLEDIDDYKAQYMRPTSQRRIVPSTDKDKPKEEQ